jgi:hypothetical protein
MIRGQDQALHERGAIDGFFGDADAG